MSSRPTEMTENVRVRAACLFQSISEDREPAGVQCAGGQMPLLIGDLSEPNYHRVVPGEDGGRDGDRAEGIAEDVANQSRVGIAALMILSIIRQNSQSVMEGF